jgi:hypothetical protein
MITECAIPDPSLAMFRRFTSFPRPASNLALPKVIEDTSVTSRNLLDTTGVLSTGLEPTVSGVISHIEDETDSDIELFPTKPRKSSKLKLSCPDTVGSSFIVESDSKLDSDSNNESVQQPLPAQPSMKRSERILDAKKSEHAKLIASATKVGVDYYDSDADDLPGPNKGITKPHLFRNVAWGAHAKDMSNDADFPTYPSFFQFVPGRFERLADGTASDQKAKLIVKLTDHKGKKHIYTNPPPRDWNNQEAISVLNKRTVQQIRRTTEIKFRARVPEYIDAERQWLLANLTAGKPINGWKRLVSDFNDKFAGKLVQGGSGPRPARTQSSLSKEVGRFVDKYYGKGLVPVLAKNVKKGKRRCEGC